MDCFTHLSRDSPRVCPKKRKAPCPPVRNSFLGLERLIGCSTSLSPADSAFIQARVRLNCSDSLIYTGLHTFRRHTSPPRAAADGVYQPVVRTPREDFFPKNHPVKFFLRAPLVKPLLRGTQRTRIVSFAWSVVCLW